jgi:hypothetical protein
MTQTADVWKSNDVAVWEIALAGYWTEVRAENTQLEKSLEKLKVADVRQFSPTDWYDFLLSKYFPWKYTSANRLATTTADFLDGFRAMGLLELDKIRRRISMIPLRQLVRFRESGAPGRRGCSHCYIQNISAPLTYLS